MSFTAYLNGPTEIKVECEDGDDRPHLLHLAKWKEERESLWINMNDRQLQELADKLIAYRKDLDDGRD